MTDTRTHLLHDAAELKRLLEEVQDDRILAPQFEERLAKVEQELGSLSTGERQLLPDIPEELPRAALFLRGGGVEGTRGVRAALAGEALTQYDKMFCAQAVHDERIAARAEGRERRRRGTPNPSLLFTGTPRGSFGFEFVPQRVSDETPIQVHAKSLENVADAIATVTSSDASLERVVDDIPAAVLAPMRKFLRVLSSYDAELRFASANRSRTSIPMEAIKAAVERLDNELVEESQEIRGVFRGLTRETCVFDMIADDIGAITGKADESLGEDDLDRIDALTNERCIASVLKRTIRSVSGEGTPSYILQEAWPEGELKE